MAQSCGSENLMAGDWIKMRGNLWDDPRVAKLCDATEQSEAAVIGALYWLWATADQHTTDGFLPGLTPRQIDRKTGVAGFANALSGIGWMKISDEGVEIVNFDDHNGASAKKRCQTAKRVAKCKAGNAEETQREEEGNAQSVTDALGVRYLEKEIEKEKEESKERRAPAPSGTSKTQRGSRLDPDWTLPDDWAAEAREVRSKSNLPPIDVVREADQFRDYWSAKAGRDGVKLDWLATWRNWVRNSRSVAPKCSTGSEIPEWEQRIIDENNRAFPGPGAANASH